MAEWINQVFTKPFSGRRAPVSAKRREQLRRAQKTHRERAQAYHESLERQIVQIQAKHSEVLQATRAENDFLRQLLQQHGIPIPTCASLPEQAYSARVIAHDTSHDRAYIQMSHSQDLSYEDMVELGVNFVLQLEHPCMAHAHLLSTEHLSNNHAFTASSTAFAVAPMKPEDAVAAAKQRRSEPWGCSAALLQSLLSLSGQFVPDGEINPTQMWDRVQTSIASQSFDITHLEALQDRLVEKVICSGFGTVMPLSDFQSDLASFSEPACF